MVVAAQGSGPGPRSGTSGRGSVPNTVASTIDDSEEHASTTVSNSGPSVPETSGVPTTDDSDSGKGSGSGGDDNSGSGRSGGGDDDEPKPEDDQPSTTNPD